MIDLDEIINHLDYAKRYENYIVSRCPFHDDRRPSFFVYEDWYRCESCGENGSTNSLLDKLDGTFTFTQPQPFRNPFTRWLKQRTLAETLKLAWQNGPSVYLRERGVDDRSQYKLGLGILENYVTFPIRDNKQKIIGAIARTGEGGSSTQKYIIPKAQDANLLFIPSWQRLDKRRTIYLTFGILDAISLYLMGAASISTTCGMRMDVSYLDKIRKRIMFIPDFGEEKEAQKFAGKMGWRGAVMRCNYPDGIKDVNDIFMSEHKGELLKVLDLKDIKG